jgi:hypothetical protein
MDKRLPEDVLFEFLIANLGVVLAEIMARE